MTGFFSRRKKRLDAAAASEEVRAKLGNGLVGPNPPPAEYFSFVWWDEDGNRDACVEHEAWHGGGLIMDFDMGIVVGYAEDGTVAFRSFGKT